MWRVFVDRGGTFTDLVAVSPDGRVTTAKLLSDAPDSYDDAVVEGIRRICAGAAPGEVKMGTTVATNALLTRQGERCALVTNAGFEDLLAIGYQTRPDLFSLRIDKPSQLAETVVGVTARMTPAGELTPLDRDRLRADLLLLRREGITSLAVALLHSWRHPGHEDAVADLAAELGFENVAVSHEVSGLMRLVPRADTTVVDAYLTPVLRRRVDAVRDALPRTRLLFMQSSGGLTDAAAFFGRDAILSGPAGGVVGAIQSSKASGFGRLIGFDMGGTSTDVCHYAGELERRLETTVAGVRLRAPMLAVDTIAAGGGSICRFDGQRYHVGPQSAGADPGPACYRRGGPLTITDCHVALDRIQPLNFPHVFGSDGAQPLDAEASLSRLSEVAERAGQTVEAVAMGFLDVAVSHMARAIKRISSGRGHDVTGYALCAFGGAGGQLACRVADALGMQTVLIPPAAGVLSALGIGLADERTVRQESVQSALSDVSLSLALERAAVLAGQLGGDRSEIRLLLRYAGSDTPMALPVDRTTTSSGLARAFGQRHLARFGFQPPGAPILDALEVESIRSGTPILGRAEESPGADGVLNRAAVRRAGTIAGPVVIVDDTSTVVVEPGWRARVDGQGALVLSRTAPLTAPVTGEGSDPMLLTVFNHRFMSVAEQMGVRLQQTAQSVNIKERRDYSCAVFDGQGRLIANAPHIPVHLGSMGACVDALRERVGRFQPGDAWMINDPYGGGTHLPDVTVVSPVFVTGHAPAFFVASRGHHGDIGGMTPGSMPAHSTHIGEEGVLLRDFHLVSQGLLREDAVRAAMAEVRNIEQTLGDLRAQVAANAAGATELIALAEEVGMPTVLRYMGYVRENAAESVRRLIDRLQPGRFRCELDDGCAIEVEVRIDVAARRATLDFTGTSPQQAGNVNAPRAVVTAVVLYVFRTLTGEDIPLNSGCLDPLEIVIPDDCMLNPKAPAAVVAGNVETSQVICDAILGAVGAQAGSQGTMNNLTFGNDRHQYYETLCGGAGAGPGFDGAHAVHTHMTNSRLTDPEVLEWRYPVRLRRFAVRHGSGGAGEFSGGDGVIREIEALEPLTISVLSNRRRIAPHGLAGGGAGATGANRIERSDGQVEHLTHRAALDLLPGDVLVIETPGGGGYGKKAHE